MRRHRSKSGATNAPASLRRSAFLAYSVSQAHRRSQWRRGGVPAVTALPEPGGRMAQDAAPPEDYNQLCDLARSRLLDGAAAEAGGLARRALAVLPRGLDAQRLLGLALLELGEARPALNAFQSVLAADPADVVAQVGVAEAQERLGGPAAAEADWLRAWELEPGVPAVESRLLAARRAAGALDATPGPPALTRAALARIYLRGGLYEHAAAEARALLARDPDRPDMQLLLAEAFWRTGDAESAAAIAAALLERRPDCAAANLLVAAHWQAVGKDPEPLLARVRMVDPAGRVAARLFDDRQPPPLFELAGAAPEWARETREAGSSASYVAVASAVATNDAPRFEDTAPLPVPSGGLPVASADLDVPVVRSWIGGPVAATLQAAQLEPETQGGSDLPPSLTVAPAALPPSLLPEPVAPEAAPPPPTALPPGPVGPPEPPLSVAEPPAPSPPTSPPAVGPPTAEPAPTAVAPAAEPVPPGPLPVVDAGSTLVDAANARAAGDRAMRQGRHVDAMRAYGVALRYLRAMQRPAAAPDLGRPSSNVREEGR